MANENEDLKNDNADDDAKKNNVGKKADPPADDKKTGTKGKSAKGNKNTSDDDDDGDPDSKPKFTQNEVNKFLANQKTKFEKQKDLSEKEKAEAERDEARSELTTIKLKGKFSSYLGIENETKATRLFNAYKDDFEYDDKGNVTNLKDIKEAAKKEFPNLFPSKLKGGKGDGGDGDGDGDGDAVSMNDLIRRRVGRA